METRPLLGAWQGGGSASPVADSLPIGRQAQSGGKFWCPRKLRPVASGRRGHGGAAGARGGSRPGGGRRGPGRARGRPGQERPAADRRGRVRHLLRGGPRADGAGQRPPGHPAAVQDRARPGDARGAGERGRPGGRGAAPGARQPAAGGAGAARPGAPGRRPGGPRAGQDGRGPHGSQPAALHTAGAEGGAAGAQLAEGPAAAGAGGAALLPEWADSPERRPRSKTRERSCGSKAQRCRARQRGADDHEEAVLFPVGQADLDCGQGSGMDRK